MNRITKIEIAVAVVGAMTFAGIAAIAPPAQADDLDVIRHTVPAAVTETADHGQGTYCRIGLTIPAWTCDQELAMNGENKEVPVVEGRHHVDPKPTTTPPGPTTGGDL